MPLDSSQESGTGSEEEPWAAVRVVTWGSLLWTILR